MLAFASLMAAFVEHSPALALAGALLAWLAVSGLAYLASRGLVRVLGEKQYLPEIPTTEAAELVSELISRRGTVATAESCSGGMVAALLSSVPDAGTVFRGGITAYTDDVKSSVLDVSWETLTQHGAVSPPVAAAMARGARHLTGADVGIAVTGITGSAAAGRPPGLTFVAVAGPGNEVTVRRFDDDLGPGRNDERAVRMAIRLAIDVLTHTSDGQLPGDSVEWM
jgi:nicotinamide-nucleotide amidase